MQDDTRRMMMFFFLCVPVRLALAWYAWKLSQEPGYSWQKYLFGAITLMIGVGMIWRAYLRDTGRVENKGFAGGEVYWNSYLHGGMYLMFSLFFLSNFKHAWFILVADIFIGVVTVLNHYFNSGVTPSA